PPDSRKTAIEQIAVGSRSAQPAQRRASLARQNHHIVVGEALSVGKLLLWWGGVTIRVRAHFRFENAVLERSAERNRDTVRRCLFYRSAARTRNLEVREGRESLEECRTIDREREVVAVNAQAKAKRSERGTAYIDQV